MGVVVWVLLWVALGALVWHDIRVQTALSDNVTKVGTAIKDTGEALSVVGGLPLVGGGITELADQVAASGAEVESAGRTSSAAIRRAALVSGFAVSVTPSVMVLLLYAPVRLAWRRDVASISEALRRSPDDAALDAYLARRALSSLPWGRLQAVATDPWRSLEEGEVRGLADAEIERLGLVREVSNLTVSGIVGS